MVMDDLFHFWPEFEIDYTPLFNIQYSYLPPDLKVLLKSIVIRNISSKCSVHSCGRERNLGF